MPSHVQVPTKNDLKEQVAKVVKRYTIGEEIFNSVSHGIGALLSIAALVLLVVFSVGKPGVYLLAALVYSISMLLEYTASTLYHAIQHPKAKAVFRVFDHVCIYFLIAGTYTPFALITLQEHGGIYIFAAVWIIAFAGIFLEVFWREKPKWVSVVIYLIMGWLVVFKLPELVSALPTGGLILLIVGGLAYSIGTIFYLLKKVPYMHSVWHLFVLAGSIFQFFSILLFVY